MLEIAQTPCAVHGGSAERDDDKQQVRSERLSRSCGGASCSAVPKPSHPDRPPSLALLPCSCAAGSASAGPRGERPDFIFLLLAGGDVCSLMTMAWFMHYGIWARALSTVPSTLTTHVLYTTALGYVFRTCNTRYQLEDTGSVKLKSTRDPQGAGAPGAAHLSPFRYELETFFSSPRVCPPLNGQARCRSRSDSGSGAARRVRR